VQRHDRNKRIFTQTTGEEGKMQLRIKMMGNERRKYHCDEAGGDKWGKK
jgi:hypothetical protein